MIYIHFRLKKLDCFEACSIQIGDKAFYRLKSTDIVSSVPAKSSRNLIHQVMHDLDMLPQEAKCVDIINTEAEENAKNLQNIPEVGTETDNVDTQDVKVESQNGLVNDDEEAVSMVTDEHIDAEDEDSDFEDEEDACLSDACSTASNASVSSTSSQKKKKSKKGPILQTKLMRKKKLKRAKRREGRRHRELQAGDRIPVEIVYTFSSVEVMWQVSESLYILLDGVHSISISHS